MGFNLNGNKSIKQLALSERPREKALSLGVKQLSTQELLALLIASGIRGHSAIAIAENLLHQHGSLWALARLSLHQWIHIKGISKVKAIQLMAVFALFYRLEREELTTEPLNHASKIYTHFRIRLGTLTSEQLLIIKLNHQLFYTGETIFRLGSQASLTLDYRDLFVDLMKTDTRKFLLIHNHPSGDTTPSQADISTTIAICEQARKLGFLLVDHVIMSAQGYFSMKEQRIIG